MDKKTFKSKARRVMEPIVSLLSGLGVPPVFVSMVGLAFSLYGALVVAGGALFWGGVLLLISGLCDVADGAIARQQDATSSFGAFIDSTFDRVTEFAYFGGIIFYFVTRQEGFRQFEIISALVALSGSVLTSYARARAEGLGFSCTVGVMERPERIALLTLGLLLGKRALVLALVLLAASTLLTFIQRIFHIYRLTRSG